MPAPPHSVHLIKSIDMNESTLVQFYPDAEKSLTALTQTLIIAAEARTGKPFYVALSGGDTAQHLFRLWTAHFAGERIWNRIRFFWVDERCVSPLSEESNYYWAEHEFFKPVNIPGSHIHRIRGEAEITEETARYNRLVTEEVRLSAEGMPQFDCILLGIGSDGHIASLFPGNPSALVSRSAYEPAVQPESGQYRITLTGQAILSAREILIPLIGERKRSIVKQIYTGELATDTPAHYILSKGKHITIFSEIGLHPNR